MTSNRNHDDQSTPSPAQATGSALELQRIFELLRWAITVAMIMIMIWRMGDVLMVIFASTLLAVVLHGLAQLLRRAIRLPYAASVAVVAIAIVAAVTLLLWSSGPQIGEQASKLRIAVSAQIGSLHDRVDSTSWGHLALEHLPSALGGTQASSADSAGIGKFAGSVTGFLSSAMGLMGTIAVIAIAGLYFALSPSLYVNGILRLVASAHRPLARDLLLTAGRTLWAWTAGQALDMFVVGLLSGIGLWFIGVPLALALGVVAGLANFIPYIGAIIGAIPAILLGLSVGTQEGLMVMGLYVVIQFFEGNVMAPLIQRHAVDMPPGLTILSQTVFGAILGIPGLILASPLTAALLAVGDHATTPLSRKDRVGPPPVRDTDDT